MGKIHFSKKYITMNDRAKIALWDTNNGAMPQSLLSATIMNTNFWKTDLSGMWHLIFLNIPLLPKIAFKWFPKPFFKFAMIQSFNDSSRLEPKVLKSYFEMFCDTEATQYWIRLYKNMAKSLALQQFPHLSLILPENKTRFPQRPTNSYQVSKGRIRCAVTC